jgi:hypothetical protein
VLVGTVSVRLVPKDGLYLTMSAYYTEAHHHELGNIGSSVAIFCWLTEVQLILSGLIPLEVVFESEKSIWIEVPSSNKTRSLSLNLSFSYRW